ncbi:hypothetical protein [Roseomonas sp. 18066]|uniref:hypothetical protein n=1 Tax=Roseomonas sp. 18066 TaxID=2681412 RepID=UPI00135A8BAF|nr:hypothetical protein [Roseomonas sp. 18066]
MSPTMQTTEKLALGPVARMTFGVIGRQPATFLGLPLLVVALPSLLAQVGVGRYLLPGEAMQDFSTGVMALGMAAGLGLGLFGLLLHYALQAVLTYAAVADFNGRRASALESVGRGLAAMLPALGAAILMLLGIGLGFLLLVIPGLMLVCIWAVTVPAAVVERPGAVAALRRSRALTRGHRWRIFGLLVFYGIISVVLSAIPAVLAFALIGTSFYWVDGVLQAVLSSVSATIGATGSAAIYAELRRLQEGAGPESLASIFD